ncbi:MAG TPA: GAP family protein [Mycobacterium sp.]|nr:GAP family protein [Mycobacterium sp.]
MWSTVLVMAIAVIFEPIRIALVVLMLNRRRPMLQLLAFLCGGLTMGIGVGLVVLFILRATPLATKFTVAQVQIAGGLLALLIAVVLATNVSVRTIIRRTPAGTALGGDAGVVLLEPTPTNGLEKLSTRARHFLQGSSLCVAGVSGLGTALPSANYMCAMAAILASGAAPAAQAQALLTFNVVAFTVVEIPLISYLAAPHKTRAFLAGLQAWLRSRRRRDVAVLVAAGGCVMLALGMSGL